MLIAQAQISHNRTAHNAQWFITVAQINEAQRSESRVYHIQIHISHMTRPAAPAVKTVQTVIRVSLYTSTNLGSWRETNTTLESPQACWFMLTGVHAEES